MWQGTIPRREGHLRKLPARTSAYGGIQPLQRYRKTILRNIGDRACGSIYAPHKRFALQQPHIQHQVQRPSRNSHTHGSNSRNGTVKRGFFKEIDVIIPVPLSKEKRRLRGYNQCDYIARGLSEATGIPIDTSSVIRHIANETQTHKQREARWKNVESVFSVTSPESLKGKHILLVDDVVTTGATLSSCGKSILAATPDARLSIFALSSAGRTI
ncbi:MAG: ComF family protein [Bacteroidaceae bacterium]|nr:ComF family protein [Bacteroidaceae bacterium]